MKQRLLYLSMLVSAACYGSQMSSCETGRGPTPLPPSPTPTATPSATPTPSPSPTPDPCSYPVTGLRLAGPILIKAGDVFKIDVTPVSAAGLLEGELDRCNHNRTPIVESMSAGLRCVGQCSGFGPQFVSNTLGAFNIRIRLEGISEVFAGTITTTLLNPCKKFICPDPGGTPTPTPRPEPSSTPTPTPTPTPVPTPSPAPSLSPCKLFICPKSTPTPSPRP